MTPPKPTWRQTVRDLQQQVAVLKRENSRFRQALTVVAEWRVPEAGVPDEKLHIQSHAKNVLLAVSL